MIEQAKEEGELVFMGSHAEEFVELLTGFKEEYPFLTLKGIQLNTTKTVNRSVMEVKAGRVTVDLVDIGSDGTYTLAREDALQKPEAELPHLRDFDPRFQPSSGLFVSVLGSVRNQGAYNTELVPSNEVPTSWEEMSDPKWKGKTIISSSGEEMPLDLAYLWRKDGQLNWERSFAFWEKLFQQEPLVGSGYRRGNEQLAAGERALFWFTSNEPPTLHRFEGAPTDIFAFPKFPGSVRTMGILKGAPHPAAAWLFIDYLTSPEGQFEYTEVIGPKLPLNPKAKLGKYAQFTIEKGCTQENTDMASPDFTLDAMAAKLYSPENLKKSEDFFLEQMGVR
jgi:iron(III) transport system substrate-binding protein